MEHGRAAAAGSIHKQLIIASVSKNVSVISTRPTRPSLTYWYEAAKISPASIAPPSPSGAHANAIVSTTPAIA